MKRALWIGILSSSFSYAADAHPYVSLEVMGGPQTTKIQDHDASFCGKQYGAAVQTLPFHLPLTIGVYASHMDIKATSDDEQTSTRLTGNTAGVLATLSMRVPHIRPYVQVGYDLYGKASTSDTVTTMGREQDSTSGGSITGYRAGAGFMVHVAKMVSIFVEGDINQETYKITSQSEETEVEAQQTTLASRTLQMGLHVML